MDQNDSPVSGSPPENVDLAKQYQDILDRYSEELSQAPPPPETPPTEETSQNSNGETMPQEPVTALPPETYPETETQSSTLSELADDQDIPLTEIPAPEPPPPLTTPEPAPPVYTSDPTEILPPPPVVPLVKSPAADNQTDLVLSPKQPGGFFKFLFIVSLLIFLGVFGAIVYTVFFVNNSGNQNKPQPVSSNNTPTPSSTNFCELNDRKYAVGQSFAAADGCNTCSCTADLTIVCTEKACDATPSSKVTPIKAGYPIKNIVDAINKLLKTSYQPIINNNKNNGWTVDLTKTSTKTDITAIKSAITSSTTLVLDPNLSGEAVDWKEVYVKNTDTCELEMANSVLALTCFQ